MANNVRTDPSRFAILFLINLLIAAIGPHLIQVFANLWDYVIAFVVGIVLITLFDRRYLWQMLWSIVFLAYLTWQIILSNLSLAWLIVQPNPKLDPGIVAIPLTITSGLEITLLASAITLTPGTLSVDLGTDANGHTVLYVHNLRVGDPEQFRTSVKNGFERMILRVSRGGSG
jgi:multicomponent Na+:H+ antiporter subunit E